MVILIVGISLVALAGAAALVYFIGKGSARGRTRTTCLAIGLAVAFAVFVALFNVASVYYRMPVGWMIALGAAGVAVIALFVLVGMDVKWRASRVLAMVGLLVATGIALGAFAMAVPGGSWLQPIYATRAKQIAEANGFTAYLPTSRTLPTDVLPVDALESPDAGLQLSYQDFWIRERKAPAATTDADLGKLVAPGVSPMGEDGPKVPAGATPTTYTVLGKPAVGIEYTYSPTGGPAGGSAKQMTSAVLVLQLDGTRVWMVSESGERESKGTWVPFENLSLDELVKIAATLEPAQ